MKPYDRAHMIRAIEEAEKCPTVRDTTPRLGAILAKGRRVLATVFRCQYHPDEHAEYMLLKHLRSPSIARGATLYVTLEPCQHRRFHERYDKKSCVQHIIDHKIARVVIGALDPNPDITTKGFQALASAGVQVDWFPDDLRRRIERVNAAFTSVYQPGFPDQTLEQYLARPEPTARQLAQERRGLGLIVHRYESHLVRFGATTASALRLLGSGSESYGPESVHVKVVKAKYALPKVLQQRRPQILRQLIDRARASKSQFFDGPCVRMNSYRFQPTKATSGTEQKHLWLTLAPVSWYEFSIANHWFARILHAQVGGGRVEDIQPYVELDAVARNGDLEAVALSNITSTATTLLTSDGYLVFSSRSTRVSTGNSKHTSGVAENFHWAKDGLSNGSREEKLPIPFRTVLRGIEEELSPKLAKSVAPEAMHLLGICFDLEVFHPDLLFLVALPVSLAEFRQVVMRYPGVDFHEGQQKAISILGTVREVQKVLTAPGWIASGKASLMRALEFIRAKQTEYQCSHEELFARLRNHTKLKTAMSSTGKRAGGQRTRRKGGHDAPRVSCPLAGSRKRID